MKDKIHDLEPILYERLGVKFFDKCTLALEKIIHFKDKGQNINYHILYDKDKGQKTHYRMIYDTEKPKEFIKFLYYNGSIHVKNAIVLSAIIIVKFVFFPTSLIVTLFLILNLVKDLYCVMLQRYSYIRTVGLIKKAEETKVIITERRTNQLEEYLSKNNINLSLTENEKVTDIELVDKMQKFLSNLNDAYIDESSVESLIRIKQFLDIYDQFKNNRKNQIIEKPIEKVKGV